MKSISQVAELAGISTRTLQYYDEINLLKPSELTASNYRLYNDEALQQLQQILFFKELGFQLKDIKELLQNPKFNKIEAFKKQKELFLLKRNRTDRLISLLSRLEKGEPCMSFKEFDLSDYIATLESFKNNNIHDIIRHWRTIENFNLFIQKVKEEEPAIAKLAISQYGSIEKYTEAMKYNMEHFSEIVKQQETEEAKEILEKSNDLYTKLTSDMEKDISSEDVQLTVHEIVKMAQDQMHASNLAENFKDMIVKAYSSELTKSITDTKYGAGASDYIVNAIQFYFRK